MFVHLDRRDDGVALITLDRPKMNAMSRELLTELRDAWAQIASN